MAQQPENSQKTSPDAPQGGPQDAPERAHLTRWFRFGVTGGINTAIDLSVFALCRYVLELGLLVSNTLAFSAAVINSFVMNKRWTFGDARAGHALWGVALRFLLFTLAGLGLANGSIWLAAQVMPDFLAKCVSVAVTMVWNYATYRRFVFTGDKSPAA